MLLPALGDALLTEVSRADVQSAVVGWSQRYAASTVHVAYGYVASVYKSAVDDRLVQFSPCVRINLPAEQRGRVVPMTVDQVQAVSERVPDWYRAMVILGAATGMRGGELRGVTWDRVSPEGVVQVDRQLAEVRAGLPVFGPPKSSAGVRTVAMGGVALAALRQHQEVYEPGPEGIVFRGRLGSPIGRSDANEIWSKAAKGLGLRPRSGWHDLRHFHASALIGAGLSPRAVADRLGHADPSETLGTYAHLWPSDQERAVSAIDGILGQF